METGALQVKKDRQGNEQSHEGGCEDKNNGALQDLLEEIRLLLEESKAENIVVLNIAARSALADYMVIAGGTSARYLDALADRLVRMLKERGCSGIKTEGMGSGDWVLVDAGDIIVHLFRPEIRAFYRLEKIWGQTSSLEAVAENPA